MENRFEIQGNSLIIHLPKEVDHMVTDEIRRDSDDIIRKKYIRTITFDFSGTAFMDSSGIGLIMGRYRMMGMKSKERGKKTIMENTNEMKIIFDSRPENEGLARVAAAAFCTQLNPTLEEVADLKTAVSEAVTNCIIHAYEGQVQKIEIFCRREGQKLWVDVIDKGVGIRDVAKAMEPLFTTKPEKDRSGMGFTFMEAFMDEVTVESQVGYGTVVHMKKTIGR